jgi:flavin reductase (DIM6/NTAB) family NADH-FMN oxidoreductase RutF
MHAAAPFSAEPPSPPFSRQDFRAALGLFATGVTIVTARAADGTPVGLTANSFNSVSMSPPLVLWSLALQAGSLPVFQGGSHYAIHILTAEQRALAERFAARGVDRFAGLSWREGSGGVPLLDGAAAVLECRNRSRHEEGDHVIFVGEVEHCRYRADASPLIFHGGRFYTELPL